MTEPGSYTVVRAALLVLGGDLLRSSGPGRRRPWPGSRRSTGLDTMAMPPLALAACDLVGQDLLGLVLHRPVDGEDEVVALHRRDQLVLPDRDRAALRVLGERQLAGRAGEHACRTALETRQPLVVDVDRAEQRARHRPVGHGDRRLVEEGDARRARARPPCRPAATGDLAGQVAEPVVGTQLLLDGRRRPAPSTRRERGRLGRRVGHQLGIHEDRTSRARTWPARCGCGRRSSPIGRQRLGVHRLRRARRRGSGPG